MPVTDLLERNCKLYGDEVALVELNPMVKDTMKRTWKEFDLVQQTSTEPYRREITWSVFDEKANRVANMLLSRGIKRGDRVAILMFNCLEWLPIYFGILKSGAIAVPFNFRFDAKEIQYCADLAEVHVILFGPQFIGRIEAIEDKLSKCRLFPENMSYSVAGFEGTNASNRTIIDFEIKDVNNNTFEVTFPKGLEPGEYCFFYKGGLSSQAFKEHPFGFDFTVK